MKTILGILQESLRRKASDVYIICGAPAACKVAGEVQNLDEERLQPHSTHALLEEVYALANRRQMAVLEESGDDDFSFTIVGLGRFRCNAYKQRGTLSAVLRAVSFTLPKPEDLSIPFEVLELANRPKGLILVTGPAGSGKSTTLACIIDRINRTRNGHIITLEDPIEYLHTHNRCLISQREILHDTHGYDAALRAALRQAPNVILMGEMRDTGTIHTVVTAAETGQLVLSTLHTVGAAKTIDRVIDAFPANQQQQIRCQFAMVVEAVVSQRLIPAVAGGLVPAFEVMIATPAIRNMIREGKVHQMDNVLYAGAAQGMRTMDMDLLRLYRQGIITKDNALFFSSNPETMQKKLSSG